MNPAWWERGDERYPAYLVMPSSLAVFQRGRDSGRRVPYDKRLPYSRLMLERRVMRGADVPWWIEEQPCVKCARTTEPSPPVPPEKVLRRRLMYDLLIGGVIDAPQEYPGVQIARRYIEKKGHRVMVFVDGELVQSFRYKPRVKRSYPQVIDEVVAFLEAHFETGVVSELTEV